MTVSLSIEVNEKSKYPNLNEHIENKVGANKFYRVNQTKIIKLFLLNFANFLLHSCANAVC